METLIAYIASDRRRSLAAGVALPERSSGAALFADISGFTPLTEALVRALGPQRGTEELPRQLNQVYDALIAEVERYGGAVLNFAGDAITCWFGEEAESQEAGSRKPEAGNKTVSSGLSSAAHRAAACALALQTAMAPFKSIEIAGAGTVALAIKVAVASGPARRLLVGDPGIQLIDVLAGETLYRMAAGEHLAGKGEVLIDAATVAALGSLAQLGEWRSDDERNERFAVLTGLAAAVPAMAEQPFAEQVIPDSAYRPWLLPPVYERLRVGMGEFLTELRPIVALFLRFGGIDYDDDPLAGEKLNSFVLWVQRILKTYDGYLLQLTVGDKGSFFYAAFGAPTAHEDDAVRACLAALELREPRFAFISSVQIGVSQGRARTGAYGAATRRTYGVLGDEINMAARLMQHAPPGQAIVSPVAQVAIDERFVWEQLPAITVKGKAEPIAPFRLVGLAARRTIKLHEPRYGLPMVGRTAELGFVLDRLAWAARGAGQIVSVVAEAGMGKSRLVAEVVRQAQQVRVLTGEAQSYGTNTPYLVWQNIFRELFDLDPASNLDAQVGALRIALARIDPALLPRLPLLGPVLGFHIPDSELTRAFDARLRKESLEALLVTCLRAKAVEGPLLLVLEDCHWLDALSHDLLEVVGRAIAHMPVLLLLASRPFTIQRLAESRVSRLSYYREISLDTLLPDEVAILVLLKLSKRFPDAEFVPAELLEQIKTRTQGNPFYIEELLNYWQDQGLDPRELGSLPQLDLPPSLHSLILSRIDYLTESQKSLIKVASVVGRLFRAAMLWGLSVFSGERERVQRELNVLSKLDLTPLDTPEPELSYLFKHIVTQEVAYESLPFATRAVIHAQIGSYLEQASDGQEQMVDLLAFHYDRSENQAKRREYLLRAGAAAQAIYANSAAIDYYRRLLALLPAAEQVDTLTRLGQVLELTGQWDEASERYQAARALAEQAGDNRTAWQLSALIGEVLRKQGRYADSRPWSEQALAGLAALDHPAGLARALHFAGTLEMVQGDYATAATRYSESFALWQAAGDLAMAGSTLSNMAMVDYYNGDTPSAIRRFEESLTIRRQVGNPLWVANSLGNLGMMALDSGDYERARAAIEESLGLERATGDRAAIAVSLNNLGKVVSAEGDYGRARALYGEALNINRDLGDQWGLTYLLEDLGVLAGLTGQPERALRLVGAAAALRDSINAPLAPPEQATLTSALAPARAALGPEQQAAALSQGRSMTPEQAVAEALQV